MRNTDLHNHENNFEDECPICMEGPLIKGTKNLVKTNCCGKKIHEDCLETWMKTRNNCPMCRGRLDTMNKLKFPGDYQRIYLKDPIEKEMRNSSLPIVEYNEKGDIIKNEENLEVEDGKVVENHTGIVKSERSRKISKRAFQSNEEHLIYVKLDNKFTEIGKMLFQIVMDLKLLFLYQIMKYT